MRRGDRLFQIIQILRTSSRAVTAQTLANEFELSTRTIYRDILELQYQNIPIHGEAGVGYVLDKSYNLPPITLTPEELEVALLGAHWVAQRGDATLARQARSLLSKIQSVLPKDLQPAILKPKMFSASRPSKDDQHLDLLTLRTWIRESKQCEIVYVKSPSETSQRVIWPLALVYFESSRLLVAWCETRHAFRHFRTDRIERIHFLDIPIPENVETLFETWRLAELAKGYEIL